jgi:hypothetical protein
MQLLYSTKGDVVLGMVDEVRARTNCILGILRKRTDEIHNHFIYDGIDCYPNGAYPAVLWLLLSEGKSKCSDADCKAEAIKNPIHRYL